MDLDLSIYVSCYNESSSIIDTLQTLLVALYTVKLKWEILVIDDVSTDNSVSVVQSYIKENNQLPIKHYVHEENIGLNNTIFEAAQIGTGKYFWCVAGDNPMTIETAIKLLSQVGCADIIIPNVLSYEGRGLFRRLVSFCYAMLVRWLAGCSIRYFNGSSIFLREKFAEKQKQITGFGYSAELIIRLLDEGQSYVEVPVVYQERQHGKSTAISWAHFIEIALFFSRLLKRRFYKSKLTARKVEY